MNGVHPVFTTLVVFVLTLLMAAGCDDHDPPQTTEDWTPSFLETEPASTLEVETVLDSPGKARFVFDAYCAAVIERNGLAAVRYVTAETIDYYDRMVELSLEADERQTRALGVLDKLMVLMVRHRLKPGLIRTMTGKDLFVIGIEDGWTSDETTAAMGIESIRMAEHTAQADMTMNGRLTGPGLLRFVKENGGWKLNLLPVVLSAEPAFEREIRKSGLSEDEFLLLVAGLDTDKAPGPEIWRPIGRSDVTKK